LERAVALAERHEFFRVESFGRPRDRARLRRAAFDPRPAGDNTFSNYSEAHRAFWRQTALPLVTRVQKSFQAWLAPGYGPFRFDYNADRLEALASERAAEWDRFGKASFLMLDEQREAVGYGPAPKGGPTSRK
jgi:phage portal protein BeeE